MGNDDGELEGAVEFALAIEGVNVDGANVEEDGGFVGGGFNVGEAVRKPEVGITTLGKLAGAVGNTKPPLLGVRDGADVEVKLESCPVEFVGIVGDEFVAEGEVDVALTIAFPIKRQNRASLAVVRPEAWSLGLAP